MKSGDYNMSFPKYVSRVALVIVFSFAILAACVPVAGDSPFDMDAISQALQALVLAILPALGALVARWLNVQYQWARARMDENQLYMLDTFIRTMVYAAEQLHVTEAIDDKLDWVTLMVQNWLIDHNLPMDAQEIRARIEAAVKQELPKLPPTILPPYEG
jgi:hypothetical protein